MAKQVKCAIEGCASIASRRGWCDTHYRRWLRRGGVDVVLPGGRKRKPDGCAVEGCTRQYVSRGFCDMHYRRFLAHGDPLAGGFVPKPAGTERWDGYRVKTVNRKQRQVHTLIAEQALGKLLPPEAIVHHVDGNKGNNTPNNLVICPNNAYHMALHKRMRQLNWSVK